MKQLISCLRIIWRMVYIPVEVFAGFILAFWCCSIVLSHIPVGEEHPKSRLPRRTVYITSNGVHSDIVLPMNAYGTDWVAELGLPDSIRQNHDRTELSFGWGQKEFFMKTKEWSDLTAGVLFRSAFHVGSSAMHVVRIPPPDTSDPMVIRLSLTREQYERLENFIRESFSHKNGCVVPVREHPYGQNHFFFDADRSYGIFYTCNSWTNSALKASGQRACLWTPLQEGIYDQYKSR